MKTFAVTGAASGIGAAVVSKLRSLGHHVVTVDLHSSHICADLSTPEGRGIALQGIVSVAPRGLDGLVPCAGVGPQMQPALSIPKVNYFGTVSLIEGLRASLEAARGGVVLISSNSATLRPYDADYVGLLLAGDEPGACRRAAELDSMSLYGGSKLALVQWMRKNSVDYVRCGVRMNAIAPGYTRTALTEAAARDPAYAQAMLDFVGSIPVGRPGEPEDQANAVAFLMSEPAAFICGAVIFVDGGHDAMFRPDRF
jgi:NAD(P)-dependent dehydrogenase (short-subunit alcohol dehydrogenase family)